MTDLMLRMSGKDFGTILGLILGFVLAGAFFGISRLRYLCIRHWRKKHSEIVIGRVTKCEELSLFPGTPRYLLTVEYNDNSGALETEELISFSPAAPKLKEVELSIVSYADRMSRYGEEYTVKPDFEELKQFPQLSEDEKEAMKRKFENYLAAEHPNHATSFADGFLRPYLCAQKAEFADKKAHQRPKPPNAYSLKKFLRDAVIFIVLLISACAGLAYLMVKTGY